MTEKKPHMTIIDIAIVRVEASVSSLAAVTVALLMCKVPVVKGEKQEAA